jgi:hypothetical protein
MSRKRRDYRAEYRSRIARGLAKGVSRSRARGHPRASEQYISPKAPSQQKLEQGVAALHKTKSLSAAARQAKVAPERLRRYVEDLDFVEKRGGRWVVGTDPRIRNGRVFTLRPTRPVSAAANWPSGGASFITAKKGFWLYSARRTSAAAPFAENQPVLFCCFKVKGALNSVSSE